MQDKYISLDPEHADSTSASVRQQLWTQRLSESQGGDAANLVGIQGGTALGLLTWSRLRTGGFTMTPLTAAKMPKYMQITFMAGFGWWFGVNFVASQAGDNEYYKYLMKNRGAILNGTKSLE